ncbi:hypothetical protein HDU85_005445 [Gaertneriomyces sp. JEL0708]|nr:hypothetical protein HDU85_005445 [Gaertneriomyces sp. JEL0708]
MWESFVGISKALHPVSWFRTTSKGTNFDILPDLNGVVKDREMSLVLPAGKRLFLVQLRVIANERKTHRAANGLVTYGGVSANQFDRCAGDASYTAEEDVHCPTVTVTPTLHFALRTKTPTAHEHISRQRIIRWVRALSGGERKRMTITEAMIARAAIG